VRVVTAPLGSVDVIVTDVAPELSDGDGAGASAPALGLVVVCDGSAGVVYKMGVSACVVGRGFPRVRTVSDVVDGDAVVVSVADALVEVSLDEVALDEVALDEVALDEVVLESVVETEVELPPDVVVVPASADVVVDACSVVDVCVLDWSGGAGEPVEEWLLGAAMTESLLAPVLEAGGGGDWPEGRTTYVQSLSSRMDCAPLLSVTGVRVTLQVCVIVPT